MMKSRVGYQPQFVSPSRHPVLISAPPPSPGADDFTPVLIYVTIKAQPEYLASNLAFIERYRTASRLVSADQYFFVQVCVLRSVLPDLGRTMRPIQGGGTDNTVGRTPRRYWNTHAPNHLSSSFPLLSVCRCKAPPHSSRRWTPRHCMWTPTCCWLTCWRQAPSLTRRWR